MHVRPSHDRWGSDDLRLGIPYRRGAEGGGGGDEDDAGDEDAGRQGTSGATEREVRRQEGRNGREKVILRMLKEEETGPRRV